MDLDQFHQITPVITIASPQLDTEEYLSQNIFEKFTEGVLASRTELHKGHATL